MRSTWWSAAVYYIKQAIRKPKSNAERGDGAAAGPQLKSDAVFTQQLHTGEQVRNLHTHRRAEKAPLSLLDGGLDLIHQQTKCDGDAGETPVASQHRRHPSSWDDAGPLPSSASGGIPVQAPCFVIVFCFYLFSAKQNSS